MKWIKAAVGRWRKRRFVRALGTRAEALLRNVGDRERAGVLVISHDAHLAGAQRLLLSLLGDWKRRAPFSVKVICVGPGVLRGDFERLYPTLFLSDFDSPSSCEAALWKFLDEPFRAIYSSTVVNGPLLDELRGLCAPIISHSHEMQAAIERWASGDIMATTLTNSDFILAGCNAVARNLHARHSVPEERLDVVYDFIDLWRSGDAPRAAALDALRDELGIAANDIVVFGCGTTDWRKGPDLFLSVALSACKRNPHLKFVWIGGEPSPENFMREISTQRLSGRIQFIGNRDLSRRYYYVGHIFALTSREDPCPLVALEAANAELPVVCFEGAGDIPIVLGAECGAVVPFADTASLADEIVKLAENSELRSETGKMGSRRVESHHSTEAAARAVEATIARITAVAPKKLGRNGAPLVSVIVPNYNHRRFLPMRLASVARQSFSDIEIILLDDASTDDSRKVLEEFVAKEKRARLVCNEMNSGSTFKQWRKGLSQAQGKYIWIAESDDAAAESFLKKVVNRLEENRAITIAHAQSLMIGVNGEKLGTPDAWLDELAPGRWRADFTAAGIEEVRDYLANKNTIPNASAVVFRNFPGIECLVEDSMRLCADWLFWIRLLARGEYTFVADKLNYWRQNSSNARSRPPGVLEWEEGQKVLIEVAGLLGCDADSRKQLLERFHQRCRIWSGGLVQ